MAQKAASWRRYFRIPTPVGATLEPFLKLEAAALLNYLIPQPGTTSSTTGGSTGCLNDVPQEFLAAYKESVVFSLTPGRTTVR
eukprot:2782160-Rhodomonas_salina.3